MSLIVRHDDQNGLATSAAIALLLAQAQQQQADEQQAAQQPLSLDAIRQSLGPAAQSRLPLIGGQPSYRTPPVESVAGEPSYTRRAARAAYDDGYVGGGGGGQNSLYNKLLGGDIQSQLADQRFQNQDALAQDRYSQQAQLQDDRQARQLQELQIREADMMGRQMAQDVPQWIQQGVSSGALRYSPAQARERQDLFDSIDKINSDDRFTPEQRANFIARQRERIRAIDLAPQEVPPNERPVSPQQQAEQITWEETDPTSGLKVRKYLGSRNGSPQPELDPISKAHLDDWQDAQRHKRQMELKQFELANKQQPDPAVADAHFRTQEFKIRSYIDKKQKVIDNANKMRLEAEADLRDYNDSIIGETAGQGATQTEAGRDLLIQKMHNAAQAAAQAQQDIDELYGQLENLHASHGSQSQTSSWQTFDPAVQAGASPDLSQAAPIGEPTQAQPKMVNGRVLVDSEEQARAMNLPPGTPTITSQGRTATWYP